MFLVSPQVPFCGGSCSAELGCELRLAEYEHSLAERRLRLSIELEADKERAKVLRQPTDLRSSPRS